MTSHIHYEQMAIKRNRPHKIGIFILFSLNLCSVSASVSILICLISCSNGGSVPSSIKELVHRIWSGAFTHSSSHYSCSSSHFFFVLYLQPWCMLESSLQHSNKPWDSPLSQHFQNTLLIAYFPLIEFISLLLAYQYFLGSYFHFTSLFIRFSNPPYTHSTRQLKPFLVVSPMLSTLLD